MDLQTPASKVMGLDLACLYLRNSGYTNIKNAKDDELGVVCEHGEASVLVTVKVSLCNGFPDASISKDKIWEMARTAVEYQSENPEMN